jgi:purine-binding chemotaxis protein CheW
MQQTADEISVEDIFLADDDGENTQADKYLLFSIGEEVYGIAIAHVTEIIEMQRVTEVPGMPEFVKGVINLRGRVIPVIDLRLRFGMSEREYDDRTCIIIVNIERTSLGFIVDTVAEVHDILESNIHPAPRFKSEQGREQYISGLGKIGDRVTILIDSHRVVREQDLRVIQEAV